MKVVIQCAARKESHAGTMRTADGRAVYFVAEPDRAPRREGAIYARPDDRSEEGRTWRDALLHYNAEPDGNPFGLLPAYRLYRNPAYMKLARSVGVSNLFVLSAGWGLLPAEFLTPDYDITFAQAADGWKRRRSRDLYRDFRLQGVEVRDPLLFFGGSSYLGLFQQLTDSYHGPRIAWYNTRVTPTMPGVEMVRFETTARTNWHYQAVDAFVSGGLRVPELH